MTTELFAAVVSAAGAILAAAAGYVLTKRAEREADWRKEKLERYKAFVAGLSEVLEGETSAEGQERFSRACNDVNLFAPQAVLDALRRFRHEIFVRNPNRSIERHDQLLTELFLEIRKDLGLHPRDDPETFRVHLWSSGKRSSTEEP